MITLRPDEKIYLICRRHRFVLMRNLSPVLTVFFAILVLIILLFLIPDFPWPEWLVKFFPSILEYNLRHLFLFFLSILLLVLWSLIFLVVINYYLDYWIVTNERTIRAELLGLFNREASSVNHDKIQDITVDIKGFFPALLRFGDLHLQTAGEFREVVLKQIPNPDKVKDIIFQAQREFLKQKQ